MSENIATFTIIFGTFTVGAGFILLAFGHPELICGLLAGIFWGWMIYLINRTYKEQ